MVDSGIEIEYHRIIYDVDANRKLFDDTWKIKVDKIAEALSLEKVGWIFISKKDEKTGATCQ
jgi:hypothetical protein